APPASTPCPMILQLQWAQVGAIAWIALEAVEGHGSPGLGYLEGLVVFVATNIACGHGILRPALPERRDQCRVLFDNGSRWRWFRRRNGNSVLDRVAFPDHRKRPEKRGSNAE